MALTGQGAFSDDDAAKAKQWANDEPRRRREQAKRDKEYLARPLKESQK